MEAEKIVRLARNKISRFCINECKAYCCRKGFLILNQSNFNLVLNGKHDEYTPLVKELNNGRYSLFMGQNDKPCPSLKPDFKCQIHKNVHRPTTCQEFPVYIKDNKVFLSNRCLAVRAGLLFPYVKRLQALGYKIVNPNDTICLESFNCM